MRVGITSGSARNPYGATLLGHLARGPHEPVCVVQHEARVGLRTRLVSLARTLLARRQRGVASGPAAPSPLERFARAHGLTEWDAPIPRRCARLGVTIVRAGDLNAPETVAAVRECRLDVLINAGGGIFRRELIEATRLGVLNAHMGPLPAFRGMNALEWSLFHRGPVGVTLHLIDAGIDTGDLLGFREIDIEPTDTIEDLRAKSLPLSVELVARGLDGLADGTIERESQDPAAGRQFFVMHPRLRRVAESRIREREPRAASR